MAKWLILFVAAYVVYRLFTNDLRRKNGENTVREMERKVAEGEMVRDPECGTYISADSDISVRDGDIVHRFCSYDCRDKYLKRLEDAGRELPPRG